MMSINKIQNAVAAKKRKGFSLPEILVACAVIVALSVGAFFGYNQAQQTRKMAQMHNDMEAIANACLAYEATNINSLPPTDIADLLDGLTADESVDGSAKENFITTTKDTANGILDPWGVAYEYNQAERTISCTPNDADGTAMTTVTRRF